MILLLNMAATVWSKAWPILLAILFFGLIILVHEFGHFICAKLSGVRVNEFAIGMGPRILSFGKKETKYALRLFPIGGFCSMEGEDEESEDTRSFNKKPVWKKMIIVVAGAIMNLLLGLILVGVILTQQNLVGTAQVHSFREGAVSQSYGLQEGDKFLNINGTRVYSSYDVSFLMMRDKDGVIDFVVERDGQKVKLDGVKFNSQQEDGRTVITYDFVLVGVEKTFGNVVKNTLLQTASIARLVWLSLFDLVTGNFGLSDLAGPVGTMGIIAKTTSMGIVPLLNIMAFITINIGVFNLLPIPALDGGRLFFLFIEAIRRKPIKPKYEGYVHAAGMAILLLFMAVVTFNDILNIFRR